MALTHSQTPELGSIAPDFSLPGVDGKTYSLKDFSKARALVVAFICNHCPYVIAVQGRINELAREYASRGVVLIGINSNDSVRYPDDSFQAMKARAKEQGYVFPYLQDEAQTVARAYGAVCTPEFFAYSNLDGFKLEYSGRLDDQWKDPEKVTTRDLARAIDGILQGEKPQSVQHPSMGCSIKWKAGQG